ncbi:MAG: Gfo/Idh/MocA family oxidoreductase [Planctomycetota bacterium]
MTSENVCRWGFMSTATIGQKNWLAIKNSGNGTVAAVASRSVEKAQAFIDQCQSDAPQSATPVAFGSYDELIASDAIDAVYIPLPTGLRHDWVIKAAEHGKHVMCEKPCARDVTELKAMVDACAANNVQFMDGIMYMHTDRLQKLREVLDSDQGIGKLKRIAMQFSFCSDSEFKEGNIRTNSELEPHGCLGDLGWYTIRLALFIMNYQMPVSVSATMINQFQRPDSPAAVPMELECRLKFNDDVTATFYNSFLTGHQQWAHISGTEGHIKIKDFVLPYSGKSTSFYLARPDFAVDGCDFTMVENRTDFMLDESGNSATDAQETKLFRTFANCVVEGKIDPFWPEASMKTQQILDACMKAATTGETVRFDPAAVRMN